MNKEQFEEIMETAKVAMFIFPLRLGQAIFNEFKNNFPNEVEKIRATENDCFLDNSKIVPFIDKILELTNADEECKQNWYNSNMYDLLTNKYKAYENPN